MPNLHGDALEEQLGVYSRHKWDGVGGRAGGGGEGGGGGGGREQVHELRNLAPRKCLSIPQEIWIRLNVLSLRSPRWECKPNPIKCNTWMATPDSQVF